LIIGSYKDFEEYGMIGSLKTCALVGRDGSIDWLCLPELGSPSVFASILDSERGGRFQIKPSAGYESVQSYHGDTNILKTAFTTSLGKTVLTDFMEVDKGGSGNEHVPALYRKVECVNGETELEVVFAPGFDYARKTPEYDISDDGVTAKSGDKTLFLRAPCAFKVRGTAATAALKLSKGDHAWFVVRYKGTKKESEETCEQVLVRTKEYWSGWAHRCRNSSPVLKGPQHHLFVRSGLILKMLSNPDTGAIAAAPTASLPERIGGVRNWDYRYTWIRDASFTTQALFHLGHVEEARGFQSWIERIIQHDDPSKMQIMYGLHGEKDLTESTLDNLSGYRGSSPVRIGNGAARQKQLDIYGELVNGIYDTSRYGADISGKTWDFVRSIVDYVCDAWNTEDCGIWEVRGGLRHFVYSKIMCWVAVDRGIRIAGSIKADYPDDRWNKARDDIKKAVLEKGFSEKLNSFVQSFGSEDLDATSLLIPVMGFLPADDPKVLGTIEATLKYLTTEEGLVYRYKGEDGLPGSEGHFILCSFWLVKALSLAGKLDKAEEVFNNMLKYVSPLGLLSEEIDTETGKQIGNFPQAFSHLGLINAALYLGISRGKEHTGPRPMGM